MNEDEIEDIKHTISEQEQYLHEAGMSDEEIIQFLESEKLYWTARVIHDVFIDLRWMKKVR